VEVLRQYILSVLAASIICAIAVKLAGKQGFPSASIKLTAALFLIITAISPLVTLRLDGITSYFGDLSASADAIIESGENAASKEASKIISERVAAYILDKAASYGMEISVSTQFSDAETIVPDMVVIEGNASPYAKQRLQQVIAEDLGIPKENQIWN
jgi:hypothetical protein